MSEKPVLPWMEALAYEIWNNCSSSCSSTTRELESIIAKRAPAPLGQAEAGAQFELEEINKFALSIGIASPRWSALEKQLARHILLLLAGAAPLEEKDGRIEMLESEIKQKDVLND